MLSNTIRHLIMRKLSGGICKGPDLDPNHSNKVNIDGDRKRKRREGERERERERESE